jgi:hypothetical protein
MAKKNNSVNKIKRIIKKCQKSPDYFIEKYCCIEHPAAGIIPFNLFKYQRESLQAFLDHRFTIFTKCRQSGISTLSGAYALWKAMFQNYQTILIVSKRDREAKGFLEKNVKLLFRHLPEWMQTAWKPSTWNEHEIVFANGSKIISLPSGPETLRFYSASLNIIDEAGFCPHMEKMWGSGYPTMQHGGRCIVISTSNGIGNWYWKTLTDAQEGANDFQPIVIDWWDMDWAIEYTEYGEKKRICPTDGLRKCETPAEKEKYGLYWSPWLEEQYRQLVQKGGNGLFRQEMLRDFLGSGNTVLDRDQLLIMRDQINDDYKTVDRVDYAHPLTGESHVLEFNEHLWVWYPPKEDHLYSMGVDISTGEAHDASAVEIFDVLDGVQVAELLIKCQPGVLAVMADYLGRWYNNAFAVPERTGVGIAVCQDLEKLSYPNLFRKHMLSMADGNQRHTTQGHTGYNTTGQGKPVLNKALIDNLGRTDGFVIKSRRLVSQAETYIHLGGSKTGAEKGSMNDDLVLATGLALIGVNLAVKNRNNTLIPFLSSQAGPVLRAPGQQHEQEEIGHKDNKALMPVLGARQDPTPQETQQDAINRFSQTLITSPQQGAKVSRRKHHF